MKTELTLELHTSLCICDAKTIFSAHRFCAITRNLKYESILNVKTGAAVLFYPSTRHYTALLDTTYCLYGVLVSVTHTHTHCSRSYSFRGGCVSRRLITTSGDKGCHSLCGSGSDKIPDAVSQLEQGLRVLPPSDVVECVVSVPPLAPQEVI